MNPYAYVGGNPVSFVDPFGLTQQDIDNMVNFARQTQPDLIIPTPSVDDLPSPPGYSVKGQTDRWPWSGVVIDSQYLQKLTPEQVFDLYDTIVHESLHYNDPWYKRGLPEYQNRVHRNNNEAVRKRTEPWKKCILAGSVNPCDCKK